MNHYSYNDIIHEFTNALADSGIATPDPIIDDGQLHRFHVQGDKRGTKNGAYILYNDGKPSGWFQHFNAGITGKWTASGKSEPLNNEMRKQIENARQQRQLEQQTRHENAAIKARQIWALSKPLTQQSQHPYLIKKRVEPHRIRRYYDALTIPIYNEKRELVNLQFIDCDGNKRFLSGGKKKGCFTAIREPNSTTPILLCEGWATGASLHQDTGHFTAIALDAGNLEPVARVLRKLYPISEIIVCGDNDSNGVGQNAAKAAAIAVNGKFLIPEQTDTDFNDILSRAIL